MKFTTHYFLITISVAIFACNKDNSSNEATYQERSQIYDPVDLNLEQASGLASMPLKCINQEFPNKLGQTLKDENDLGTPQELHPAFYGCFDWHSALHGHWTLVKLLKMFPEMENSEAIISKLETNISKENILKELDYFQRPTEKSYERTYGWSWLLKLADELHSWDHPAAKRMSENLEPLTEYIVQKYLEFLPKLTYPIRVGEHTNTAFGLVFPYDYAILTQNDTLKNMIESRASAYYLNDQNCPLSWEPSGFDFISPCLEEANLMRRILSKAEFDQWIQKFLPGIENPGFKLAPAEVSDRSDGKLVHLDGLNFSRAWCLKGIAQNNEHLKHLENIANQHIQHSLNNVVGDAYEGGHWLASFAVAALNH